MRAFDPYALPPRYVGEVVGSSWSPPPGFTEKVVALTFDDGPDKLYTAPVLQILKEQRIPATMFVVGIKVNQQRKQVEQERSMGLEIANHTYSHFSWPSPFIAGPEVLLTESAINMTQSPHSHVFRPPYGQAAGATSIFAKSIGMASVLWTNDTHDWELTSPTTMVNYAISQMRPGDIVLMHDNRQVTPLGLRQIIRAYRTAGYQFLTVTQMLWRWDAFINATTQPKVKM
ncbi:MAG: polysaccharide deacetylase family protein [Chthonomonas sp.]|nr:polysaccharide deacetylase family protein [Chthonomonas sp.]